jgi:hypothetical protein
VFQKFRLGVIAQIEAGSEAECPEIIQRGCEKNGK